MRLAAPPLFFSQNIMSLVLPPGTLDGTEGLLGMNILKRFHFRIDQAGNALLLDPIH